MHEIHKQERLGIISVRSDPHYTLEKKKRIIKQIAVQVHSCRDMSWLICGDFNFEVLGEKAYNTDRCAFVESSISEQLGLLWNSALGDLVEHHQPDFTRAQNGPYGATLSRIDRIYSNFPAWRLLTSEVRTSTVGHITDKDRLSDHLAVLSFMYGSVRKHSQPLPLWATKHPYYAKALSTEMQRFNFHSMSPAHGVQQVKKCMRTACFHVASKSLRRGAATIEERIYWSLVCARALSHGIAGKVVQAMMA